MHNELQRLRLCSIIADLQAYVPTLTSHSSNTQTSLSHKECISYLQPKSASVRIIRLGLAFANLSTTLSRSSLLVMSLIGYIFSKKDGAVFTKQTDKSRDYTCCFNNQSRYYMSITDHMIPNHAQSYSCNLIYILHDTFYIACTQKSDIS